MKEKRKLICIILFLLYIYSFFFGIILAGIDRYEEKHEKIKLESNVERWWKIQPSTNTLPVRKKTFLDKIKSVISQTEDFLIEDFPAKTFFIDIHGGFQNIMNTQIIDDVSPLNTVYKLKNGQLTFYYPSFDSRQFAANIAKLDTILTKQGTRLLYIQAPFKAPLHQLPYGMPDVVSENTDVFINYLSKYNINILDIRKYMPDKVADYANYFYSTDHHWTIDASYKAFTETINYLQSKDSTFIINDEIINRDCYFEEKLSNSFIGTLGRRVGKYYISRIDDFSYLRPKFQTNYSVDYYVYNKSITRKKGSFNEAILDLTKVSSDNIMTNRYAVYLGGDHPYVKITNLDNKKGKVLIFQDSFGLPYSSFLSLAFREIQLVDLRSYREHDILQKIETEHYDYVLFLYNPSAYRENNAVLFDFD